jgi:hypothetical protein
MRKFNASNGNPTARLLLRAAYGFQQRALEEGSGELHDRLLEWAAALAEAAGQQNMSILSVH